jgi:hypothetical protein
LILLARGHATTLRVALRPPAIAHSATPMAKRKDRAGRPGDAGRRAAAALALRKDEAKQEKLRQDKRSAIAGDETRGVDVGFPPDVLLARKLITQEMRDEGLRFAQLAWWLYGTPAASCDGLYARVAAGGAVDGDLAPLRADEESDEVLERVLRNKRRFERMVAALGGITGKGDIEVRQVGGRSFPYRMMVYAAPRGTLYEAVRNACQYLEPPGLVISLRPSGEARTSDGVPSYDLRQMARLIDGLAKLVELRTAEDKHVRRKHQPPREGAAP